MSNKLLSTVAASAIALALPRGVDGAVQKFNDMPPRYLASINVADPLFNRKLGDTPPMTEHDEADVIAFINTLVDGYRDK